jgi:hypothetical protein
VVLAIACGTVGRPFPASPVSSMRIGVASRIWADGMRPWGLSRALRMGE